MTTSISITDYEPWMLPQIASLNAQQYGLDSGEQESRFKRLWHHPEVEGNNVVVVALDGNTVAGVQSYNHWPYVFRGQALRSLQSGGTLVHPDYRRRGLFMRMLEHGNRQLTRKGVDLVTGFPVPMSLGGLLKDGWMHAGSPRWWVRPMKLGALVKAAQARRGKQPRTLLPAPSQDARSQWLDRRGRGRLFSGGHVTPLSGVDYLHYRYEHRLDTYRVYDIAVGASVSSYLCKPRIHRGLRDLVVGEILTSSDSFTSASRSLRHFLKRVRSDGWADIVSILLSHHPASFPALLAGHGFAPTRLSVPFIIKPIALPSHSPILSYRNWNILNADVDTW